MSDSDFLLYPGRRKLILPILGTAVFVMIGIQMVTRPTTTFHFTSKTSVVLVGWVGLLFFGPGLLLLIVRALWPRPILRVDRSGVTNRTSLANVPFLAWSDISDTKLSRTAGDNEVLVLIANDPERLIQSCRSPLRRSLIRKSYEMGCGVSSILEKSIPGTLEPVKAKIDSFHQP
jgi:hypothetical protein